MPPTDTFFQYLLTLGLGKNSVLSRIIVVNPMEGGEEERYSKVFARALPDRQQLQFRGSKFDMGIDQLMLEWSEI